MEGGGQAIPLCKEPAKLNIKEGEMAASGREVKLDDGRGKKTKWLNMTFNRDGKESTVNAIYELTGDELKTACRWRRRKDRGRCSKQKA